MSEANGNSLDALVVLSDSVSLYRGDCREIMANLGEVDAVVTDPPYPDIDKGFEITPINFLSDLPCRQVVFWSAVQDFPLSWSAVHIWHKPNGCSSQHYERIFERNGQRVCRVWRVGCVNSEVAAKMGRDEYHAHPCQKPLKLMGPLVEMVTEEGGTVLDPFMGSGSTGVACIRTGRRFVGIEKDARYFEMARARLENELRQGLLPLTHNH